MCKKGFYRSRVNTFEDFADIVKNSRKNLFLRIKMYQICQKSYIIHANKVWVSLENRIREYRWRHYRLVTIILEHLLKIN
ncbi:MAG: hypothetical protein K0R24_650 [Gammaproteobacteria bacterium]|jgi:uncharacterized FlgJ-related protein|nr:hypothetical protein [Gammaproteobacteria bacterium]MCE3237669.1 hypothetical protein [Gammaproteobacteria bacterium]